MPDPGEESGRGLVYASDASPLPDPTAEERQSGAATATASVGAETAPGESPGAAAYRRLLQHCIDALQALTDTPVTIPDHWAQDIEINHNCEDCQELQRFLRDPERRVHRFRVRKDRRQHLHRQIDSHGCDMTHVTERQGSPQTLVCTKTRASYERRQRQFEADTELLVELRDMAGA